MTVTGDPDARLADIPALLASLPPRIDGIATAGAARSPDAPALVEQGRVVTYAAMAAATAAAAADLAAAGVRAGDRVLVVAENCAALPVLLFAAARVGAWSVVVNARLSAREVDAIREHCSPRIAVYATHVSRDAAAHAQRDGGTQPWSVPPLPDLARGPVDRRSRPEAPGGDPRGAIAALLYTTGTTGMPKGVMLTHRNLLFIAAVSSALRRLAPGDRVYGVLPIAHVYGLASVCLGTLYAGACLQLVPRFDPAALLASLARDGLTVVQGVPAMYTRLLERVGGGAGRVAAPTLRFLYAGGAPLAASLKARVERAFGIVLHNGYGLTEASPTVTQTRLDAPRDDTSVGPPIPGVEVRIVDATDRVVAAGEPGELLVRGPNVMAGYYRDAAATAAAVDADGWLHTGDIARRDAGGALFIVGRVKELIIHSGFNVYPAEVEGVLDTHPDVRHAAVVGRSVRDDEEVVAFVELAPGRSTSSAALARYAAERLAPYKRPAEIVILPALPASPTGKILKSRLRALAQEPASGS